MGWIQDRRHAKRAARGPRVAYRSSFLTAKEGSADLEYIADGLMVVGTDGAIESIGPASAPDHTEAFRGVVHALPSSLIVPAFVDTHLHCPQTRAIGSATGTLLEWLDRTIFPEEIRFGDTSYASEISHEFIDHCFAVGTGTICAFSSSSPASTAVLLEAMQEQGMRGIAGLTLMDQNCPQALSLAMEPALRATTELVERFHKADSGRIEVAVTPRFALSCSQPLMEAAARLAHDRDLLVQTHVSENIREGVETLAAFPWASDYLDVYDKVGLLGRRTILAHAVHLSSSEWDRVSARGSSIAHCPDSNFFLGSGRMRITMARERSIRVGLASDVAAGRSFDMRRAIAHAHDNALAIEEPRRSEELFRLATLSGAETLGLDDVAGSLEAGKDADFAVLHMPPYLTGYEGALRAACFGADFAHVERTYVRGRLVYRAAAHD